MKEKTIKTTNQSAGKVCHSDLTKTSVGFFSDLSQTKNTEKVDCFIFVLKDPGTHKEDKMVGPLVPDTFLLVNKLF